MTDRPHENLPIPLRRQPLAIADSRGLPTAEADTPARHPLIYAKRTIGVDRIAKPGDTVVVYHEGQIVGHAMFNPWAEIRLRMLRHGPLPPDEEYWTDLLGRAAALRTDTLRLDAHTNAYRVLHAEADGFSGLVVDRVGPVLAAEVFALGLRQPLAKRLSRTSRWIACENYAGPGSLVEIAKHHCLHGNGCANTIVNAALRTVSRGTARVPGVKYGADRAFELPPGIGIRRMAYDIAVLLLEPPARIGCEHRRSRFASQGLFDFRRQSQVQYRIHHPRHAYWGAGAHRDQQRPRTASKFPPRDRFQMIHRGRQRGGYPVEQFAARREIAAAFIRTQHEGWWYCNAHTEHTLDAPGFPAK